MLTTLLALASAAVAAIIVWLWAQTRAATLAERQRSLTDQVAKAEAELATLRARIPELEKEKSRLDTLLTAERDALQQAQARLTDTFKALAADALRSNSDEFLKPSSQPWP